MNFMNFVIAFDLNKCLKQIKHTFSLFTQAQLFLIFYLGALVMTVFSLSVVLYELDSMMKMQRGEGEGGRQEERDGRIFQDVSTESSLRYGDTRAQLLVNHRAVHAPSTRIFKENFADFTQQILADFQCRVFVIIVLLVI